LQAFAVRGEVSRAAGSFVGCELATAECRSKDKDEIRESLHCAAHDTTVNRFGRDDDF
jgi:hypothetical protein